ncbi:MAG: flagellar hook-basal body complex protein [Bacillota bacterium]|nr:flagellar hook-basal body complex protein [Bacillota bacterium]
MVRGFYALGSGILTRERTLDSISNNIANADTAGFKKDKVVQSAFGELMINRMDGKRTELSNISLMNAAEENVSVFTEGPLKSTDSALDFAVLGQGFFGVQTPNGLKYTRNGEFGLDSEGYLTLPGCGRVMGQNGAIYLGSDDVSADTGGNLYVGGKLMGTIRLYGFTDYAGLKTDGNGLFTGNGAALPQNTEIAWKTLEGSNVDVSEQMTDAISSQRSLQSCSEALKMVDQILEKAATQIAKI